jgi:hypothetical protein
MDITGGYVNWSKPGSERQRPHGFSHMWNKTQYKYKQYCEKQVTLRGGHMCERERG